MDILCTLLIGAIIGWLAGTLMKTEGQMGLIAQHRHRHRRRDASATSSRR